MERVMIPKDQEDAMELWDDMGRLSGLGSLGQQVQMIIDGRHPSIRFEDAGDGQMRIRISGEGE
jgi:hypothetical protein